jgi:hypothetical protein
MSPSAAFSLQENLSAEENHHRKGLLISAKSLFLAEV